MNSSDVRNLVNEALTGIQVGTGRPARRRSTALPVTADERRVRNLSANGHFDGPEGDYRWARELANNFHAGQIPATLTLETLCLAQGIDIVSEALALAGFVAAAPVAPAVVTPAPAVEVFDGTYTIVSGRDGGHRTLRIRTQAADASFAPGEQILGLLTGSDNEGDYTNFAFIKAGAQLAVWNRHKGTDTAKIGTTLLALLNPSSVLGAKLVAAGYSVQVSKRCFRCHRVLTHPESLLTGYGPECINHA
jgi:hypothetical protein